MTCTLGVALLDVLSLVVEGLSLCTTLAIEGVNRAKSKKNQRLVSALQNFDSNALRTQLGSIQLAGYMRGGVTARTVKRALDARETHAIMVEILIATLVDDVDARTIALDTMERHIASTLAINAAQDDAEYFAENLARTVGDASQLTVDLVRENDPNSLAELQQIGMMRRIAAVLANIEDHAKAVERRKDVERENARARFSSDYRKACIERHGYISPPDFKTLRKMPAEQLYVAPRLKPYSPRQADESQTVENFAATFDRAVVLGDPGGGKSTLSDFIATLVARKADGSLPFHITLRHFAAFSAELSVVEYIERHLKPNYQVAAPAGLVLDLFAAGNAVVIFDGLDELIDTSRRREVTKVVEIFSMLYPLVPVLVTSRRVGYDQAQLDDAVFKSFLIDEFTPTQVTEYVGKWFRSQRDFSPEKADSLAVAFVAQSAAVPDLRANPLMLSLMCILFHGDNYIPRNRPAVYEKCANLLFEKWDGHRDIEVPLRARDHVSAAMKYIAFHFIDTDPGDLGIERQHLIEMITDYLIGRAFDETTEAAAAAEEFVDFCHGRAWVFTDAGSTAEGISLYKFTHRTFLEYFAAVHLTRVEETPERLAKRLLPKVARQEWDVVAQLAVQQIDGRDRGTERALQSMLDDRRRRSHENRGNVLAFIARCTEFAVVPPSLVQRIARACLEFALVGAGESSYDILRAMGPLSDLEEAFADSDATVITSAYRIFFNARVGEAGPDSASSYFILDYLSDAFLGTLVGRSLDQFDAAILQFVHDHSDHFRAQIGGDPGLAVLLGWAGLSAPTEVAATISTFNGGVLERFIYPPEAEGHILLLTLAEVIVRSAGPAWTHFGPEQRSVFRAVARTAVDDLLPDVPFSRPDTDPRPPYQASIFISIRPGRLPQVLVDAVALLFMASIELFSESTHRMDRKVVIQNWAQREHWLDFNALLAAASKKVSDRAQRWIEGHYNLFVPHERAAVTTGGRNREIKRTPSRSA